jgi:very-short-patch-repair endonuclease
VPHDESRQLATARARALRRDLTGAERKLWSALRAHKFHGLHIRRQAPCGPYIADFLCHAPKLVIEVDGATHSTDRELARDARRDRWFESNGFAVLRFTNDDVSRAFDGVLERIYLAATEAAKADGPPP